MGYTQASDAVLCDLLSCKSKVTDMILLCDKYAAPLHRMGFLKDFRDILHTNQCNVLDNQIMCGEINAESCTER